MRISIFRTVKVSAEIGEGESSTWLDLIVKDDEGRESTVTLFFDRPNRHKAASIAAALNSINETQEIA